MCVHVARLWVCTGPDLSIVALLEDEMKKTTYLFCFFCCETASWRKSPHWDRIKETFTNSPQHVWIFHICNTWRNAWAAFQLFQAFKSCVSSLPIVTNCNFYCTSRLDLLWRRWFDFTCNRSRGILIMTTLTLTQ